MSRNRFFAVFIGGVLSFGIAAGESTPTYTSIEYPNAKSTSASGINARGDIVGSYTDQANVTHGFLLRGGSFVTIDYPGALATLARGINPQGDIVGSYQGPNRLTPGSGGDNHGFLLRDGTFTLVDYPGHLNTIPQRISATGQITGCYHDHDTMGSMYGFQVTGGNYSAVDVAGGLNVPASMHNGATPGGEVITGLYTDMMIGKQRGYLLSGGVFAPFDVPNSLATSAWDINPTGEVVGQYVDAGSKTHGFLLSAGQFFSIDYPAQGVRATAARGINPQGDVAGLYVDAGGVTHGFLLSRTRHSGN